MCDRVRTGDPGASGNGIGVRNGDPLSRREDGIALYFHRVDGWENGVQLDVIPVAESRYRNETTRVRPIPGGMVDGH